MRTLLTERLGIDVPIIPAVDLLGPSFPSHNQCHVRMGSFTSVRAHGERVRVTQMSGRSRR